MQSQQGLSPSLWVEKNASRVVWLILLIAAAPALLVFADRWFGITWFDVQLRAAWCSVPFLCGLAWRPYFILVFLCSIAVVSLVYWIGAERIDKSFVVRPAPIFALAKPQRTIGLVLIVVGMAGMFFTILRLSFDAKNQGLEYLFICLCYFCGWFLYTTEMKSVLSFLRARWYLLLTYLFGVSALSWFLFDLYAHNQMSILPLAAMAVATGLLYFFRREIYLGYWLLLLALAVFTWDLNAWHFSIVGDEMAFLGSAREIAFDHSLAEIAARLFDGVAVYGAQPYFSSVLMAPTLRLFDELGFGWRYSGIVASAFAVPFFFYFFRTFLSNWVALSGAFLIAISHFLMTFSRIGYNNTGALLVMGMAFAAVAWTLKGNARFAYVVTGLVIGLCFFVYPAAIYLPPILLCFLMWYRPFWKKENRINWMILGVSAIIVITPLFFQQAYWQSKLLGTPYWSADRVPSGLDWIVRIATQFGYSFYSFLFAPKETHHLRVAYVDVITATLVLIGLGVLLRRVRLDKFAMAVLTSFVLLALVGATHGTDVPPNTRMFLLVPWFALIAAIGLQWFAFRLEIFVLPLRAQQGILAALLTLVLGLNLYIAFDTQTRAPTGYLDFDALFIQLAKKLDALPDDAPKTILFVYNSADHHVPSLREELAINYIPTYLREWDVTKRTLSTGAVRLLAGGHDVVISPKLPPEVQQGYASFLAAHGRVECPILSDLRVKRFGVWYPVNTPNPCEQAPAKPVNLPSPFALGAVGFLFVSAVAGGMYFERRAILGANGNTTTASKLPQQRLTVELEKLPKQTESVSMPNLAKGDSVRWSQSLNVFGMELNVRLISHRPPNKADDGTMAEKNDN